MAAHSFPRYVKPGFYPARDGNGEQWWNGVSWSESRRNAHTAPQSYITPSAAAPGRAQSNITPSGVRVVRPIVQGQNRGTSAPIAAIPAEPTLAPTNGLGAIAIVLGVLSLFFAVLGPVAVIISAIALARGRMSSGSRGLAIGGLVLGIVGSGIGLLQLLGAALDSA
jgi:hypothetical protein